MRLYFLLALFFCGAQIQAIYSESHIAGADWSHSSGNFNGHRYTDNNQITPSNIHHLKQVWVYKSGHIHPNDTVQSSPIFTGTKIISSTSFGDVYALDPSSGQEIWRVNLGQSAGRRGITSYNSDTLKIFAPSSLGVTELDEESGNISHVYESGISLVAPIIHNNQVIIATLSDGIKSYDLFSKELLWHVDLKKNNVVPRIWSGFSFNSDLEMVYAVTGSSDGLTGLQRGIDDYSVSVIAVDINSGDMVWSFQHIQKDVWDLDLVGNPILFKFSHLDKEYDALVALTKTGDVLLLDAKNGTPIFKESFEYIPVPQSSLKGEILSKFQKRFLRPEPFSNTVLDPETDFSHLNQDNAKYVNAKLRNSRFGFFIPPSVDYDVVFYGLHGGAEWPGGAIDLSDLEEPKLIVPHNRDPWILRAFYDDKLYRLTYKIISRIQSLSKPSSGYETPWTAFQSPQVEMADKVFSYLPTTPNNTMYSQQCSSCHGSSRQGTYQTEGEGDKIFPPLVGLKFTDKWNSVTDSESLISLHNEFEIDLKIQDQDYQEMMDQFHRYDKKLKKFNLLGYSSSWQILLDKDGYPASKPPWGFISKINLNTGLPDWKIPFGSRVDDNGVLIAKGDINFGGVLVSKAGIIFATGTPDELIYAYDSNTGNKIWDYKLPHTGSAPPASFIYKGCQLIVTQASGGRFVGYQSIGDSLVAFKLESCTFGK